MGVSITRPQTTPTYHAQILTEFMGNSESRFREAVRAGDHSRAYELFYNKKVIRDNVDPKELCYELEGASILHYTARHAMQPLYDEFLENRRVSPLIFDGERHTCLHLICITGSDPSVRYEMLKLTITQISNQLVQGALSRAVSSPNINGDTPLHFACSSGLQDCVQLLVDSGADATVTNSNGQTPADIATNSDHNTIAKKLETHIVFSEPAIEDGDILIEMDPAIVVPSTQNHVAMENRELQSMKDRLLIETAELLGVSLFTAEALLRNYEWSKEQLLDAWITDPATTCDKAGVDLPPVLTIDNIDESMRTLGTLPGTASVELDCSICYLPIDDLVELQCEHTFCKDCWQQYLHEKIKSGQVHNIVCPEYACYKLIPIHIVEKLVSRDMALKYLQFDIKAFVDSNPNIRWCPHPGCGQAIKKPTVIEDPLLIDEVGVATTPTGITVHCGQNHYFCWVCGQTAHEPCTCEEWKNWLSKVNEMRIKIGSLNSGDFSEAASSQWISSNSKPCPTCKSPIEKTDGCNHMKCSTCRYDFCWMCMDPWKKHNSSTGGYFDCNRFKVIQKVEEMLRQRKDDTKDYEKISHFQHYHNRYKNHCHSLLLETGYLQSAGEKMTALRTSALEEGSEVGSVLFLEEAVRTLVEARHTITASYGYGYFLMIVPIRDSFEKIQGDLEEQVEVLAEVVARPYLRKPRAEIIKLTRTVMTKRLDFVRIVEKELIAPPLPPWVPPSTQEYLRERREQVRREREETERRVDADQEEEERQVQEAMNVSKKQYEEDSRLQSDTEFAILLSMSHKPEQSPPDPPEEKLEVVGDRFMYSSPSQNSDPLDATSQCVTPLHNNLNLDVWRKALIQGNEWASSSSSSSEAVVQDTPERKVTEQLDEDMATAIALSLSTMNEVNDLDTDRGGPHHNQLQEVLHSTSRKAANV